MKRFYETVTVEPGDKGWHVALDGRKIKTAHGAPQAVPSQALASAMAEEWSGQGEEIDTAAFIFRDLADFAIDIAGPRREETLASMLAYAETDTLCYRADPDEPLFARQQELWEPLLRDMEQRHDLRFERVSGIIHRPQPPETLSALRSELERQDPFALTAANMMASLAASLIVALAALEDGADAEALWAIANCEEDWQAELWGWDAVAADKRATKLQAFAKALEFAQLARAR